jgi:hypothetical protein
MRVYQHTLQDKDPGSYCALPCWVFLGKTWTSYIIHTDMCICTCTGMRRQWSLALISISTGYRDKAKVKHNRIETLDIRLCLLELIF